MVLLKNQELFIFGVALIFLHIVVHYNFNFNLGDGIIDGNWLNLWDACVIVVMLSNLLSYVIICLRLVYMHDLIYVII